MKCRLPYWDMSFSALLAAGTNEGDSSGAMSLLLQNATRSISPDPANNQFTQLSSTTRADTMSNSSRSSSTPHEWAGLESPYNSPQHFPSLLGNTNVYFQNLQHENEQLKLRNIVLATENETIRCVFIIVCSPLFL